MITELRITNRKRLPVTWWASVESFKRRKVFAFKPGLNIVWGPNGSGKSTLLCLLARLKHCEQGGVPKVTQQSIQHFDFKDRYKDGEEPDNSLGVSMVHDGGLTFFHTGETETGVKGSYFDDDFFFDGMQSAWFRGSSGQKTGYQLRAFLGRVHKAKEEGIEYSIDRTRINSLWQRWFDLAVTHLGDGKGQPTLILDEPLHSLDWPSQLQVWKFVEESAEKVQVIVATHSIVGLFRKANYIDIGKKGYRKECEDVLRSELERVT